uniref:Uncharacterized protein n=1 Tax=Ditylenchus dipsaci TaxID=166011 RepID=A0A915CTM6_9BILA
MDKGLDLLFLWPEDLQDTVDQHVLQLLHNPDLGQPCGEVDREEHGLKIGPQTDSLSSSIGNTSLVRRSSALFLPNFSMYLSPLSVNKYSYFFAWWQPKTNSKNSCCTNSTAYQVAVSNNHTPCVR